MTSGLLTVHRAQKRGREQETCFEVNSESLPTFAWLLRAVGISQIGDPDGQFFASSSHNPARGSISLAKEVQVKPTLANAKVADLKKREEFRKFGIHDPEFSA